MRLRRLSLMQLWVAGACAGSNVSPPPGHPAAPPLPPDVAPAAWTLGETEARLREVIPRLSTTAPHRRIVTTYYASDHAAAELLADWFRGRESVAAVTVRESVGRTHVQGGGTTYAGAVRIAEQQWWELVVDGPAGALNAGDIGAWLQLLRAVPADARWRLGPSDVAEP
jgi:hypothetical protein